VKSGEKSRIGKAGTATATAEGNGEKGGGECDVAKASIVRRSAGTGDLFASQQEADRRQSQRAAILALLRERGAAGVSNVELNAVGFRYGGRIFELRRAGHAIATVCEGAGRFRFVLHAGSSVERGTAAVAAHARSARVECDAECRCFHHAFCGAGGAPCIACQPARVRA